MQEPSAGVTVARSVDALILIALAGINVAYAFHVATLSERVSNIIFVLPISALLLILCIVDTRRKPRRGQTARVDDDSFTEVAPSMAIFAAYVLSIPWLGLDLGTIAFITAFLLTHGERRWYWAIAYAIVFGLLVSYGFAWLLPYDMPLTILPRS